MPPARRASVPGRSLTDAQKTELAGQIRRSAVFLGISAVLLLTTGASARLFGLVLAGATYLVGIRLWSSTRYGLSGPLAYARVMSSRHLVASVDVLRGEPALAARLGVREPVLGRVTHASAAALGTVQQRLRAAGMPALGRPAPITAFLVNLLNSLVGLGLGVLLPPAFSRDFAVLCSPRPSIGSRDAVLIGAFFLFSVSLPVLATVRNRMEISRTHWKFLAPGGVRNQLGTVVDDPAWATWRSAVADELAAVSDELLEIQKVRTPPPPSRYARLRISAETELVLSQVLFVLSLWFGLVLSAVTGQACGS